MLVQSLNPSNKIRNISIISDLAENNMPTMFNKVDAGGRQRQAIEAYLDVDMLILFHFSFI